MHMERSTILTCLLLLVPLFVSACGGSQRASDEDSLQAERPPRVRFGNLNLEAMEREGDDVNMDGVDDQIRYFRNGRLFAETHDLDFDGEADLYSYYAADGSLAEQEFQLDFDPGIDVVRLYEDGVVVEKHIATGFDAGYSMTQYFDSEGRLLRIERDADDDGVIDVWEYYELGELIQVGRDVDGDGSPDVIDDIN